MDGEDPLVPISVRTAETSTENSLQSSKPCLPQTLGFSSVLPCPETGKRWGQSIESQTSVLISQGRHQTRYVRKDLPRRTRCSSRASHETCGPITRKRECTVGRPRSVHEAGGEGSSGNQCGVGLGIAEGAIWADIDLLAAGDFDILGGDVSIGEEYGEIGACSIPSRTHHSPLPMR
jgi:hypothetical protein